MNPLTHKKTFADVQVNEKIYILDPKDASIKAITVTKSAMHPKSKNKAVWVIEAYMPFRLDSIKDESLKEAAKFGTQVTQQFIVEGKLHLTVLLAKVPTAIATEEKYLKEWMGKNKLGLILPKHMR